MSEEVSGPPYQYNSSGPLPEDQAIALRELQVSRGDLRRRYPLAPPESRLTTDAFGSYNSQYPTGRVPNTSLGDPTKKYLGYLKGSQPPPALNYVIDYFWPHGPTAADAVPLSQSTYEDYLRAMFDFFTQGSLPGAVTFEPPSYDDVHTILSSDPRFQKLEMKIPHGTGKHVVLENPPAFGLPNSEFTTKPRRSAYADAGRNLLPRTEDEYKKSPAGKFPPSTPKKA